MANRKGCKAKIISDIDFYFEEGNPHASVHVKENETKRICFWNLACEEELIEFKKLIKLANYKPKRRKIPFEFI